MPINWLAARKRASSSAWGVEEEIPFVVAVSVSAVGGAEMEKSLFRSLTREGRVMPESLKRLLRFVVSEGGYAGMPLSFASIASMNSAYSFRQRMATSSLSGSRPVRCAMMALPKCRYMRPAEESFVFREGNVVEKVRW